MKRLNVFQRNRIVIKRQNDVRQNGSSKQENHFRAVLSRCRTPETVRLKQM